MSNAATASDVTALRNAYRSLRATAMTRFGISKKDFDWDACHFANEAADGEEVLPGHWVRGAREVIAERDDREAKAKRRMGRVFMGGR